MIASCIQAWTQLDVKLLTVPGQPVIRTMAFPKMPRGWRHSLAATDQAQLLIHCGFQFVHVSDHAAVLEAAYHVLESMAGSLWTVRDGPWLDWVHGEWRLLEPVRPIADHGTWFRLPWPGITAAEVIDYLERSKRQAMHVGHPRSEVGLMEEIIVMDTQQLKGNFALAALR